MKILYVVTQGEQGGAQKYVLQVASGMLQVANKEVCVAIGRIENEGDKWLFESLESVGVKKENIFELKYLQREVRPVLDFKALLEMYRLFRQVGPNVVHLNSSKAGVVGVLAAKMRSIFAAKKIKVVYTVHGWVFLEPMNFLKKWLFIFLELISGRLRDATIFITERDVEVASRYHMVSKLGGFLIYNGLDEKIKENILKREEARKFIFQKINKQDQGQKIVGTISNLFKTKGLEYLIGSANHTFGTKALSKVEGLGGDCAEFLFVVFGTGPENYKKALQEQINKNNLQHNFFFLGAVPDAYKYLSGLDMFTLTSLKEGLPYCLLEASLANLPIVATNVGGIPEIAKNIKIRLVESKNTAEISKAILENLQNTQECKSEFSKIYSLENMIDKTSEVYKKMIMD